MPYLASLENLLVILQEKDHVRAQAISVNKRTIEHGLLSVGTKVHHIGKGDPFAPLLERTGRGMLGMNMYRHSQSSTCIVLPPVGNARTAIHLLECIEKFIDWPLFNNKSVQIQVCSPWRLSPQCAALLAIGYYLTLDNLWKYDANMFNMTASHDLRYHRGEYLVIYDAGGFERKFKWWERLPPPESRAKARRWMKKLMSTNADLIEYEQFPFGSGRTDVLAVREKKAIENINLLATLLCHSDYSGGEGYWKRLGLQFQTEMEALLERHLLKGLLKAPWVQSGNILTRQAKFLTALQELIAYAYENSTKKEASGILQEMQTLLQTYRAEVMTQSMFAKKGVSL